MRYATKFIARGHECASPRPIRVRRDVPDVKRVADSSARLALDAHLLGIRMNAQPTTRGAWLEPILRTVLGIALLAAVVWAVTDGGTSVPFVPARG